MTAKTRDDLLAASMATAGWDAVTYEVTCTVSAMGNSSQNAFRATHGSCCHSPHRSAATGHLVIGECRAQVQQLAGASVSLAVRFDYALACS